MSNFDLN